MNGPGNMYKLQRPYTIPEKLALPTCMYILPEVHSHKLCETDVCLRTEISGRLNDIDSTQLTHGQGEYQNVPRTAKKQSLEPDIKKEVIDPSCWEELKLRQTEILKKLATLSNEVEKIKGDIKIPESVVISVLPAAILVRSVKQEEGTVSSVRQILALEQPQKNDKMMDIVIHAHPDHPPFSLVVLKRWLEDCKWNVTVNMHLHSSVGVGVATKQLFTQSDVKSRSDSDIGITIMWRGDIDETKVTISALNHGVIEGEVNIARFISRMLSDSYNYQLLNFDECMEVENWLDIIHVKLIHGTGKDQAYVVKQVCTQLAHSDWLVSQDVTIADVMLWSALIQYKGKLPPAIQKWMKKFSNVSNVDINQILSSSLSYNNMYKKDSLLKFFESLNIVVNTVKHPPVFTVDAMVPYLRDFNGILAKNLFLKDKQKNYYLLSAKHDTKVDLDQLAKNMSVDSLQFGEESALLNMLGVTPGCVTAFALVNDCNQSVKFIIDETLLQDKALVYFHPLTNSASTGISSRDLQKFLKHIGHEPIVVF